MPLTFKKYSANASIAFTDAQKEDLENTYNTEISIAVNELAFPPAVCAKLVAEFHAVLLKHADKLTGIRSDVNIIEIKTASEVEADLRKKAEEYVAEQVHIFEDEDGPGVHYENLRDQIIDQQQGLTYSWTRLSGRKLEIVNELLAAKGIEELSADELKAD